MITCQWEEALSLPVAQDGEGTTTAAFAECRYLGEQAKADCMKGRKSLYEAA